jgi:DNA-binding transcriptional MerR regulator
LTGDGKGPKRARNSVRRACSPFHLPFLVTLRSPALDSTDSTLILTTVHWALSNGRMAGPAKRYQKSLISTQRLLEFARQLGLRLGKTNPRRTIDHYIRQGLFPPRVRTHEAKLDWGFPTYAKALLVRICRLKERGLSLAQIKEIVEKQIEESHEHFKQQDQTLSGLDEAFSDPVYDYNYAFAQREVNYALHLLKKGRVKGAEQVLSDLSAVLEPPAEGERHLIVVGSRDATVAVPSKESSDRARSTSRHRSGRKRRKHRAKSL